MQWSYGFAPKTQQQYCWNTTSKDYHSHISKIERMPSVLSEAPHYPNVHKAFNNKYTCGDQEQESSTQHEKVVQVTERVESAKDDDDDDNMIRTVRFAKTALTVKLMASSRGSTRALNSANGRPSNCIRLLLSMVVTVDTCKRETKHSPFSVSSSMFLSK